MQLIIYLYGWLLLGVVGHVALWVALYNRVHATGLPRWVIKITEKMHVGVALVVPLVWAVRLMAAGFPPDPLASLFANHFAESIYFIVCCGFLFYVAAAWCLRRLTERTPAALVEGPTDWYDVSRELREPLIDGTLARLLAVIPGNQATTLTVTEKTLHLRQLDPRLDGLTIAQLSDLHYSGRIRRPYFDFVVDRTNAIDADLVVITGDIIDKDACLDWLPATLGRLRARQGTYFLLGNHDRRIRDVAALRRLLTELGLIDMGGRSELLSIGSARLLLAGNEWPWFGPRPRIPPRTAGSPPESVFRLLLAHSPDQLAWARRHQFDLMLAGHTHGGQIRFPLLGPVVSPSNFGVKYASGVFYEEPTLVHVSRGTSELEPIRLNCPPELAKLVLRSSLVPVESPETAARERLVLATQAC